MTDVHPIDVQLPPVPNSIPRDTLRDICQLLDLDPGHVLDIRIGIAEATATLYLCTPDGHKVRYGDGAATTVVTIPIA